MSIYKACDIRGKFGAELRLDHATRLGRAISALRPAGSILVGGDGRLSTPVLQTALVASLLECGWHVFDLGRVPTPLFYFARRYLAVDLGVMITASHNPAHDNGFKLTLGPLPVTVAEMSAVERLMETDDLPVPPAPHPGELQTLDLAAAYLNFLDEHIPDLHGMRIVVDCASGMAAPFARPLWQRSGAEMVYLLDSVDGSFPGHAPNPAEAANLLLLQEQVRAAGADLGVAYDGDADRVAFVDERGMPLSGDHAVVIFSREALRGGAQTIIYDQKCSRVVADTIQALGGVALRELSGHTYIKRAFLEHQAAYAGELSGHHFLRQVHGDDALAASLIFARLLKDAGAPLSQLVAAIPVYPITPDLRIPMPPTQIASLLDVLEAGLSGEASLTRSDGLRIEYPDGWALIRPSVTEPVVTLRFEGTSPAALERIIRRVTALSPALAGISLRALACLPPEP
jgi:phosphomannomutase / phosphoglucomutase